MLSACVEACTVAKHDSATRGTAAIAYNAVGAERAVHGAATSTTIKQVSQKRAAIQPANCTGRTATRRGRRRGQRGPTSRTQSRRTAGGAVSRGSDNGRARRRCEYASKQPAPHLALSLLALHELGGIVDHELNQTQHTSRVQRRIARMRVETQALTLTRLSSQAGAIVGKYFFEASMTT